MEAGLHANLELQCRKTMEIRTKHVRAGFAQALRASRLWKLEQNNMTKKEPFFGPQNVRKSRRAKMDLASRGKHIIRWIECSGVTANRWWTSRPPPSRPAPRTLVRCEARKIIHFARRSSSKHWCTPHVVWWLEKHYWADSECARSLGLARSTPSLTLDPSHCRFHCCLTTSSCYTALLLLASKCFMIVNCYALMACSMWSRGSWLGRIPSFRIVMCCTHLTVWQCDFCVRFCLFLPYQYLSWYNAITSPHY